MNDKLKISIIGILTVAIIVLLVLYTTKKCDKSNSEKSIGKGENKSQLGQDVAILKLLNYKRNGFFIDIGAADGEYLSNSYLMENKYGWNGLCVDPFPTNFGKRKCQLFEAPLSDKVETVQFTKAGHHSGISRDLIHEDEKKTKEQVTLKTMTIRDVIKNSKTPVPKVIDYMSLDVEGGELAILETFPWESHQIRTLSVETKQKDGTPTRDRSKIHKLLKSKGMKLVKELKVDDIFMLK